ncbi:MAG TPA: MFS transporter [Candidatus Aphodousia gallistercoris]|nr:MFS transporter [Candidatus Aphodousia gallistercoris]
MSSESPVSALRAIFSRTFIAISLINMFGMIGYYAIFVICTRYVADGFGASQATAGLATGIVVIGCLVGRFFTGSIIRTVGYRRILSIGVLFFLLMNVAYFFAHALWQMFLVRFISGAAMGVIGTATGTYVATIVPREFHGRGIAYFSMSTALALCFGPFIGIALLDRLGYNGIFSIASALSAVSLALLWFVIDVTPAIDRSQPKKRITLDDFIDRRLIPFSLFVGVVCLTWGNVQALLADYAKTYDVVAAASSFFLLYALASLLTRPITGKIYDAHGPAILIYPCLILMIAGLLCLAWHAGSMAVLAAGILVGLGFGNFQSVAQVSGISLVPRERFAQATSTFFIFFDLGIGLAPYLSGFLVAPLGYAGIFALNALVVALTIPLYWYVWTYRRPKAKEGGVELPLNR